MLARIAMFASSYIPLYVLLAVKYFTDALWGDIEWNCFGNVVLAVLFTVSAGTGVLLWRISSRAYTETVDEMEVGRSHSRFFIESIVGDATPGLFSYLALYLMPCLNMSVARVSDVIVMLIVMLVVGFIYLKMRITYLNPMLLLYGYRSYGCIATEALIDSRGNEGRPGELHSEILVCKGVDPLLAGHSYKGKRFHDFIMVDYYGS